MLDNGNSPQSPSRSEADIAEVEGFLADVLLCLPVLGYGFFEPAPSPSPASKEFFLVAKGLSSRGYETSNGFVVRQGSQAVKVEVPSIHGYLSELRRSLIAKGLFADQGSHYELTQDTLLIHHLRRQAYWQAAPLMGVSSGRPRMVVLLRRFKRKKWVDDSWLSE